jgi:FkbM family methyltransferase
MAVSPFRDVGWVHAALLRVRPAQAGELLKTALRIKRHIVATKSGHRFWVDPVTNFGMQLSRRGVYEPQMTALLDVVLRPSDVFVDLGGNEGYFSVLAASIVGPGQTHCVEPQRRMRDVLRTNFELNGSHVAYHPCALSDKVGELKVFLRPSTNTGASSIFPKRIGSAAEVVPCTTLDRFFEQQSIERARLIKMDCEGAEPCIIAGAGQVIAAQRVDFIALEYHPHICGRARCGEAHSALVRAGYEMTDLNGQSIYHLPGGAVVLRQVDTVVG